MTTSQLSKSGSEGAVVERLTFELADGGAIEPLQRELAKALDTCAVSSAVVREVNLALGEWLENVVQHAGINPAIARVRIECDVLEGELVLRVEDHGRPFDPTQFPMSEPSPSSVFAPRGIAIIRKLVDVFSYTRVDGCNVVEWRKRLRRDLPANPRSTPVVIVCAPTRLDGLNAGDFANFVLNLISAGAHRIVLDLDPLEYMSSAGIRALLVLRKHLPSIRGKLVLLGCQPAVRQALQLSGLENLAPLVESVEAARKEAHEQV